MSTGRVKNRTEDNGGQCAPKSTGRIGYRNPDGSFSDAAFHAEIMAGVDDTPLRIASAIKAMAQFGLTIEEAESLFNVRMAGLKNVDGGEHE